MRTVVVRRGRAKPLWLGHPWVHADSVGRVDGEATGPADDLVLVRDEEGRRIGWGLLSPVSLLRVRLLTRDDAPPDVDALLPERVRSAVALRARLFPDPAETDAYRVVHAEGDGLPGLVVDRFGPVLVAQFATAPIHRRRAALAEALLAATGARSLLARAGGHEEEEGIAAEDVPFAAGEPAPETVAVKEAGLAYEVSPREGQKTGHYADQRENRGLVAALAAGAEVLDLHAGTGGFSLAALRAGARSSLAVDASARALETAARNATTNGVADRFATLKGDVRTVLVDLRTAGRHFDVVVLDPPSLFPRRGPAGAALKGYRELNVRAIGRVKPGGLLATFTCSARLPREEFADVVRAAARECRADLRVLRELAAGPDHPWCPAAPEGRYLSGLLLRVNA